MARLKMIGNEMIKHVCEYESCMVSKLQMIFKRIRKHHEEQVQELPGNVMTVGQQHTVAGIRVRVDIIGHLKPCMTDIYLHI